MSCEWFVKAKARLTKKALIVRHVVVVQVIITVPLMTTPATAGDGRRFSLCPTKIAGMGFPSSARFFSSTVHCGMEDADQCNLYLENPESCKSASIYAICIFCMTIPADRACLFPFHVLGSWNRSWQAWGIYQS